MGLPRGLLVNLEPLALAHSRPSQLEDEPFHIREEPSSYAGDGPPRLAGPLHPALCPAPVRREIGPYQV